MTLGKLRLDEEYFIIREDEILAVE